MSFDWFPRLFIGRHIRILGFTASLGVVIPLKFLFDSSRNTNSSAAQSANAGTMGPKVLKSTRLGYHEPIFIVKKGLFAGSPVAAEFVAELPNDQVRAREVASGKLVDVSREQVHLRYR